MFRKLFKFLLKKYSVTENERLEIIDTLNKNMCREYNEQTPFGNVYNFQLEVLMGNPFIREMVREDNKKALSMIQANIDEAFENGVSFINNDKQIKDLFKND